MKPCEVTLTLNESLISCLIDPSEEKKKNNTANKIPVQSSKSIDTTSSSSIENFSLNKVFKAMHNYIGEPKLKKTPTLDLKKGILIILE